MTAQTPRTVVQYCRKNLGSKGEQRKPVQQRGNIWVEHKKTPQEHLRPLGIWKGKIQGVSPEIILLVGLSHSQKEAAKKCDYNLWFPSPPAYRNW